MVNAQQQPSIDNSKVAFGSKEDCILRMGWDEISPLQFTDKEGNLRGLQIELVKSIFQRMNCQVEFKNGDWADLLLKLKAGVIDVMPDMSVTVNRKEYALFSSPYRNERLVLYVRKNDKNNFDTYSLKNFLSNGFKLGLTKGYTYAKEISDFIKDSNYANSIVFTNDNLKNYQLLLENRIDGFFEEPGVIGFTVRQKDITQQVKAIPSIIYLSEVSFGFSKKTVNQDFIKHFNRELAVIMNTQDFKRKWKIVN